MYGRYGVDQLSVFLFALYLVFYLLSVVFHNSFFSLLSMAPILWAVFRMSGDGGKTPAL